LFCLQINSYNPRKILLHPMEKLCSVVSPWTRKRTNSLKTFCERMYSSFTSELCDYWCDSICSNPSSATGENFPILVVSCSHGQPASQTISGINTLRAYQTFYFSASLNASRGSCIYFPSAKNSFELADPVFPPRKTESYRIFCFQRRRAGSYGGGAGKTVGNSEISARPSEMGWGVGPVFSLPPRTSKGRRAAP
jgi:hypothetical protein